MKSTHITEKRIESSAEFETINMGISDDPEDQKMILSILTDTLYTNKPAAVLREYSCNAADANVEAGKPDIPIKVHLPTNQEPWFSVRDVGGGMTEEQVIKTFCKLGRSSKRNSDEYTGMFGIGSKAGFAYGESFLVTSFTKGMRTVYNCYKDSKGLPTMAKMDSSPSKEPDGVEVKVPVKQADITVFDQAAKETFTYFKVTPEGVKPPSLGKVVMHDSGWKLRESGYSGQGVVTVMGNVGYPLNGELVPHPVISGMQLELEFQIGELEIAANRESLQYKDEVKALINRRIKQTIATIKATAEDKISKASSLWQARTMAESLSTLTGTKNLTYKGIDLGKFGSHCMPAITPEVYWSGFNMMKYYGCSISLSRHRYIQLTPSENPIIIVDDRTKYWKARLEEYAKQILQGQENYARRIAIYLKFKTKQDQKNFWEKYGLEGAPFKYVSELALPVGFVPKSYASAANAKHTQKAFTFNPNNNYEQPYSNWWTTATINPDDKGVYVELDHFRPPAGSYGSFKEQIAFLSKIGLMPKKFYGVKTSMIPELSSDWITLRDYIWKQIDLLKQKHPTYEQMLADFKFARTRPYHFDDRVTPLLQGDVANRFKIAKKKMLNPPAPLKELFEGFIMRYHYWPWSGRLDTSKLPKASYDLNKLEADVKLAFPMLGKLNTYQVNSIPVETLKEYIELVERNR